MTRLFSILSIALLCTGISATPNSPHAAVETQVKCEVDSSSDIHYAVDNTTNDEPLLKRNRRHGVKSLDRKLHQFVVQIHLVIAKDLYDEYGNETEILPFVEEVMYETDYFMQKIQVRVILTSIEMWKTSNHINITIDSYETYDEMKNYYNTHNTSSPWKTSDVTILMTSMNFNKSTGIATVGSACRNYPSIIVMSTYDATFDTAFLMAHELGHILGMGHINGTLCSCPHTNCVMKPITRIPVLDDDWAWSVCAIRQINNLIYYGKLECLREPIISRTSSALMTSLLSWPMCGNEVIEEGEDCDCGTPEICESRCCNPYTCKFLREAECDGGACCSDCKLKSKLDLCWPTTNDACQIPDYCDGKSTQCPTGDLHLRDGASCGFKSTCKNGQCISITQQCKTHLAPDMFFDDICYKQKERCTELWCGRIGSVRGLGARKFIMSPQYSSTLDRYIGCGSPRLTSPRDNFHPLDGLHCGNNMICSNSWCIEDPLKNCEAKCNGNGICNNNGNCHCNDGWKPPYCNQPGIGGSIEDLNIRTCGNGIVDEGEECDCGQPENCTDSCCDPFKCKRRPQTQMCGNADPKKQCSLPKYCTGPGNTCPADRYKMNGSRCGKSGSCFQGKCITLKTQCTYIFGNNGTRESPPVCFKRNSRKGKKGNCGFDENGNFTLCMKQNNKCGKIWCNVPFHITQLKTGLPLPLETIETGMDRTWTKLGYKYAKCTTVKDSVLTKTFGLVENGTKCGSKSICINQKCVRTEVRSCRKERCNGERYCDNLGGCYNETEEV